MRKIVAIRDAEGWVVKLKKAGLGRFMFRDLPEELRSKKILHKAADLGLIEKAEKDNNNVAIWQIR